MTYRYKNNAESGPVKDRTGIRSVNIDNKIYYDIHDGDPEKRLNLADQKALFKAVLQSGKDMDGGTDSVISQWSSLAEQIYGTHSKVAARVNAKGGFENNFTTENTRNKAGYADISDALAQPEEHVNGTSSVLHWLKNCFWNIQMADSGCVLQTIERLAFLPEETVGM